MDFVRSHSFHFVCETIQKKYLWNDFGKKAIIQIWRKIFQITVVNCITILKNLWNCCGSLHITIAYIHWSKNDLGNYRIIGNIDLHGRDNLSLMALLARLHCYCKWNWKWNFVLGIRLKGISSQHEDFEESSTGTSTRISLLAIFLKPEDKSEKPRMIYPVYFLIFQQWINKLKYKHH